MLGFGVFLPEKLSLKHHLFHLMNQVGVFEHLQLYLGHFFHSLIITTLIEI